MSENGQARRERSPGEKERGAVLRSLTYVAMVQAADLGDRHDPPRRGRRNRPEVGRVLVQREVGARLMGIGLSP
jgi:hypothetical protein